MATRSGAKPGPAAAIKLTMPRTSDGPRPRRERTWTRIEADAESLR